MANTTDPYAQSIHGTNPQFLIEKITRLKIYNANYWKEECFGLTAETIIDKAITLKYCGGSYGGNNKPSNFLCLILKLLQLQPDMEIVKEYINNKTFKYLRILGAFYLRLTAKAPTVYELLEPLYNDYRKIVYRNSNSSFRLLYIDEFIDQLLHEELVCDIALPYLIKRNKLVETLVLPPRKSLLDGELENILSSDDEDEEESSDNNNNDNNKNCGDNDGSNEAEEIKEVVTDSNAVENIETTNNNSNGSANNDNGVERDEDSDDSFVKQHISSYTATATAATNNNTSTVNIERDNGSGEEEHSTTKKQSKDYRSRRSRSASSGYSSDSRRRHRSRKHRHKRDRDSRRSRDYSDDERRRRGDYDRRRYDSDSDDSRRKHRKDKKKKDQRDGRKRCRSNSRSHSPARPRDTDYSNDHKQSRRDDSVAQSDANKKQKLSKFDKIFGKKGAKKGGTSNRGGGGGGGKEIINDKGEKVYINAPEGSVEYWNQMREALGMSKLK